LAEALANGGNVERAVTTKGLAGWRAGTETAAPAVGKTTLAGKAKSFSDAELARQYGTIGKPVARASDPMGTVSSLADFGIYKPQDAERVAHAITGSDGILNKAVIKATGGAKNVDTTGIRNVFTDALDNTGVVGKERKSLQTFFDAQMARALGGAKGQVGKGSNPTDTLDVLRSFERRAADLRGKGANYRLSTPERMDQAKVLDLVKDEIQDKLYIGAGANKNLKGVLTPEVRKELVDLLPGNKQWANHVDKNIMTASDIGTVRSAQRPFVNIKNIIDEGDTNAFTFGGRATEIPTSTSGIVGGAIQKAADAARKPVARGAAKMVRSGQPTGAPASNNPWGLKGVASRTVPIGLLGALGGQSENNAEMNTMPSQMSSMQSNDINTMPALSGEMTDASSPSDSPFDPANIEANIQKIMAEGGTTKDVSQYVDLVSSVASLRASQSKTPKLSSATGTALASSSNAANTLSQLQGLYDTAGGGQGRIGGSISNALSNVGLNGETQTYNDLAASSVSQLARALNGGGQVSDADAAVVIKALPRVTDSPAVAQAKFAALMARLQAAQQNTLTFSGSDSPDIAGALGGAY
jgi:hypothetical protein